MMDFDEMIRTSPSMPNARQYNGVVVQFGFHWRRWKILFVRTYEYEPWQIGPISLAVFWEYEWVTEDIDDG